MSTRSGRLKWHPTPPPPPPPSPDTTNLHRMHNTRRRKPRTTTNKQHTSETADTGMLQTCDHKGNLENFMRSPLVISSSADRRKRVESEEKDGELAEEKWKFQAEILRAECNFLRMERKLALKKLERSRLRIEKTLKSALQSLASGRKKLCEGKNIELVLEEIARKLEELQKSDSGSEDHEYRKCKNFDKKAERLHRRLEKLTDDESYKINYNDDGFITDSENQNKPSNVEMLEKNRCSGRCKVLVRRIVEQVTTETEQWSQMQAMLGQLRQEMEELQTSKNLWETQALASNNKIQILQYEVNEWREKAIGYETKAEKLQTEAVLVKGEFERLKEDQMKDINFTSKKTMVSLGMQLEREMKKGSSCRMSRHVDQSWKDLQPLSLGKQLAREKHISKENRSSNGILSEGRSNVTRSAFNDIGNSLSSSSTASLVKQNRNVVFPLH